MRSEAGFTLLELMLVLLVLGAAAGLVVATLPEKNSRPLAEKLLFALRWSAEQAETEGHVYRLELRQDGWQRFRLAKGAETETVFLPGHRWQPLVSAADRLQLPKGVQLRVYQRRQAVTLPTSLLMLPDGTTHPFAIDIVSQDGVVRRIEWYDGEYRQGELP